MTVDHYRPVSAGGDDIDDNLVYACTRCNLYKSDFWPTANEHAAGQFVLHPSRDSLSSHIRDNEPTGELLPLTETGRFHVTLLDLNRPQLIAQRQRKRLESLNAEVKASLIEELAELEAEVQALNRYIGELERALRIRAD